MCFKCLSNLHYNTKDKISESTNVHKKKKKKKKNIHLNKKLFICILLKSHLNFINFINLTKMHSLTACCLLYLLSDFYFILKKI